MNGQFLGKWFGFLCFFFGIPIIYVLLDEHIFKVVVLTQEQTRDYVSGWLGLWVVLSFFSYLKAADEDEKNVEPDFEEQEEIQSGYQTLVVMSIPETADERDGEGPHGKIELKKTVMFDILPKVGEEIIVTDIRKNFLTDQNNKRALEDRYLRGKVTAVMQTTLLLEDDARWHITICPLAISDGKALKSIKNDGWEEITE